ncbi:MAG: hypothetical protein ACRCWJ_21380 [Casimicrobium sp.]
MDSQDCDLHRRIRRQSPRMHDGPVAKRANTSGDVTKIGKWLAGL